MRHALVIGEDRRAEHIVEAGLWQAGFASVAHASDEREAWQALRDRHPALIVLLAESESPLTGEALYRMSEEAHAPVLVATAHAARAVRDLGDGAALEGPFPIAQMSEAVAEAAAREPAAACPPVVEGAEIVQIPTGCFVLVTDGRKRLFFRNAGDSVYPRLEAIEVTVDENPADREQKTDSPGRAFASSQAGAGRSAFEEPDYHQIEEADFADRTARMLRERALAHTLGALIVVADPRTLGELRSQYHPAVRRQIAGEIAKDLVKHPVDQIERIILAS